MFEDSLFKAVTALDLLCIIAVIFFERKNPASTIAWILVLVFLPFVGFVAYVMFGSGFHGADSAGQPEWSADLPGPARRAAHPVQRRFRGA